MESRGAEAIVRVSGHVEDRNRKREGKSTVLIYIIILSFYRSHSIFIRLEKERSQKGMHLHDGSVIDSKVLIANMRIREGKSLLIG